MDHVRTHGHERVEEGRGEEVPLTWIGSRKEKKENKGRKNNEKRTSCKWEGEEEKGKKFPQGDQIRWGEKEK